MLTYFKLIQAYNAYKTSPNAGLVFSKTLDNKDKEEWYLSTNTVTKKSNKICKLLSNLQILIDFCI